MRIGAGLAAPEPGRDIVQIAKGLFSLKLPLLIDSDLLKAKQDHVFNRRDDLEGVTSVFGSFDRATASVKASFANGEPSRGTRMRCVDGLSASAIYRAS